MGTLVLEVGGKNYETGLCDSQETRASAEENKELIAEACKWIDSGKVAFVGNKRLLKERGVPRHLWDVLAHYFSIGCH